MDFEIDHPAVRSASVSIYWDNREENALLRYLMQTSSDPLVRALFDFGFAPRGEYPHASDASFDNEGFIEIDLELAVDSADGQ